MKWFVIGAIGAALWVVGCGEVPTQPTAGPTLAAQEGALADETYPVCHTTRSTRAWTLLLVSQERQAVHLDRHPRDAQPGDPVPGRTDAFFDETCTPQPIECPAWSYAEIAGFAGWQLLLDYLSGDERNTILDGNIGGYGNAVIFSTDYAKVELDHDAGPYVFRFVSDLTAAEAASCRAILYSVAGEQEVPCTGEFCLGS